MEVTLDSAEVTIPQGITTTCGAMETAGNSGIIAESYCPSWSAEVSEVCGCMSVAAADAAAEDTVAPAASTTDEGTDEEDSDDEEDDEEDDEDDEDDAPKKGMKIDARRRHYRK